MGEPSTRFGRWAARERDPLTGRQRVFIVVGLVTASIVLTVWTFFLDRNQSAHERELLSTGSRSTALVENVYRGRRDTAFVQLTLLIVDGDAEGWEVRVSLDSSTAIEKGDHADVAYDPNDPGDLVVVGEAAGPNNGLTILAWVLTGFVAAKFASSAWRSRADRRREAA